MRIPLIALCSLAVCAARDGVTPAQAQVPDNPRETDAASRDLPAPALRPAPPLVVPEVAPPELLLPETAPPEAAPRTLPEAALEAAPETPPEAAPEITPDANPEITPELSPDIETDPQLDAAAATPESDPFRFRCDSEAIALVHALIAPEAFGTAATESSQTASQMCGSGAVHGAIAATTATPLKAIASPDLQQLSQGVSPPEGVSDGPEEIRFVSQRAPSNEVNSDESNSDEINTEINAPALQPPTPSPLERPPTRLFNLETANQLADGAVQLSIGLHQPLSDESPQAATGNQLYYGAIEWGATDDLQLGLSGQFFDDPTARAIDGEFPEITLFSIAPSVKYRFIDGEQFSLGVQGSIELLSIESSLFDTDTDDSTGRVVGSLHLPITYDVSSDIQLHLTPSLSVFPGSINDNDFYGTLFALGGGASWQPSERWLLYSTLNLPLGPGGNAIDTDDQSIDRRPVWTVGTRYSVTPRVGVDLYATNGLGVTPATGIVAFIPEGAGPLVGLRLNYTPDTGLGYRSTFREAPPVPLTDRDRQLQLDGFTLSTASTLQPGSVLATTGVGTDGSFNAGLAYSPDQDFQIEAAVDEFGSEDDVSLEDSAGDSLKYFAGARLRLLDQVQGDPLSLAVRVLGGRDTGEDNQIGIIFVDLPLTYQINSRAALFLNPRLAAFSSTSRVGLGLGVNYEIARGLQLIGEVTPVLDGEPTVWAAGSRYQLPKTSVSLDVYATNAIGRYSLGTLAGDSEPRVGINLSWIIGGR